MDGMKIFTQTVRTASRAFNQATGNDALKKHGLKRTKKEIGASVLGGKVAEVVAVGTGVAVCSAVAAPLVLAAPLCLAAGAVAATLPARMQAGRIIEEHKKTQNKTGPNPAQPVKRNRQKPS